jgi:hypothetical protein
MKTLRQIRENAESKIVCEELFDLDEEFLMEDPIARRNIKGKSPSISKLPLILIFRRRSYRYFPDKQIVGLYYNNLTDKYLSVPMGAAPNMNMSEENIEEERLDEFGWGTLASLGSQALGWVGNKLAGSNQQSQSTNPNNTSSNIKYGGSGGPKKYKSKSAFDQQAKSSNAIKNTRLDKLAMTPIKENRIKLMRNMIKENQDTIEFSFDDISIPVSKTVSKKILETYDKVNRTNKKQIEKMLNESVGSFKKLVAFSIKKQEN